MSDIINLERRIIFYRKDGEEISMVDEGCVRALVKVQLNNLGYQGLVFDSTKHQGDVWQFNVAYVDEDGKRRHLLATGTRLNDTTAELTSWQNLD